MARHTPLPRFQLDTDPITEQSVNSLRIASASPNMSQLRQKQQSQLQRSQGRIRRSACSNLQSTTIPEERIYNGNRRRASLFVGRPSQETIDATEKSSFDQEPTECDYAKLCRQRCQSLYGSLANSTETSSPSSPLILTGNPFTVSDDDDDDDNDDDEQDEDEQSFETPSTNSFRYSLPDTSPSGLGIRNFLKRNKSTNYHHHHRLCLPSNLSHSLCSSTSASSSILTHSSSPLSTFRNFLSLVKLPSSSPSTKSINSTTSSISTTPHHSSLTTLTSATGGSTTTLDQTSSFISSKKRPTTIIDTQYQWHFEVSIGIHFKLIIRETTAATSSNTTRIVEHPICTTCIETKKTQQYHRQTDIILE
ncbi:unnamed protein product [Rotaria magnacalcarata]